MVFNRLFTKPHYFFLLLFFLSFCKSHKKGYAVIEKIVVKLARSKIKVVIIEKIVVKLAGAQIKVVGDISSSRCG